MDSLLCLMTKGANQANQSGTQKLKSTNELLAMCYFQYLESNQFIKFEGNKKYNSYLFANALESGTSDFEESILILLEMLRIYFPAGNPIDPAISHVPFRDAHSPKVHSDQESITLLTRVFSLF